MIDNNVLFVYNKQGQINELPISFSHNTPLFTQGEAIPKEDCLIIGLIFQNNIYTTIDNFEIFKNISNIERFLMLNSTNVNFIVPSNNYRIAGVPILFEKISKSLSYETTLKCIRDLIITPGGSLRFNFKFQLNFFFANEETYILQEFKNDTWIDYDSGITSSTPGPVFDVVIQSNTYFRVVDSLGNMTLPYYVEIY